MPLILATCLQYSLVDEGLLAKSASFNLLLEMVSQRDKDELNLNLSFTMQFSHYLFKIVARQSRGSHYVCYFLNLIKASNTLFLAAVFLLA